MTMIISTSSVLSVYSAAVLEQVIPGTLPHEYDQINIICPVYSTHYLTRSPAEAEFLDEIKTEVF
jgi:hypothetical protein